MNFPEESEVDPSFLHRKRKSCPPKPVPPHVPPTNLVDAKGGHYLALNSPKIQSPSTMSNEISVGRRSPPSPCWMHASEWLLFWQEAHKEVINTIMKEASDLFIKSKIERVAGGPCRGR
ncbi:MAG: hypothetical protein U1F77_05960 [Kiritimatiellia bacterium]